MGISIGNTSAKSCTDGNLGVQCIDAVIVFSNFASVMMTEQQISSFTSKDYIECWDLQRSDFQNSILEAQMYLEKLI